ncbi:MAG: molybdopterin synthase catalytic subunit [Methanofollis sp.]|nr:molybdopterin synthase catalytic subunit [Methanofollis sp.]
MRIIHVIGRSGSGKTTFIRALCPGLKEMGAVATIKHLGHHTFRLEAGKDTTLQFETGIPVAVGIDGEKTVVTVRSTGLEEVLDALSNWGIDYAVIEGFKDRPFPSIVIGDLSSDHVMMRNPTVDDVLAGISSFPEYVTPSGLLREIERSDGRGASRATLSGSFASGLQGGADEAARAAVLAVPGVVDVRLHRCGDRVLFAIAAVSPAAAAAALASGVACLEEKEQGMPC